MKTKKIIPQILFFLIFSKLSLSQIDTIGKGNCYVYVTEDDFFNNKKTLLGKFEAHIEDSEVLYYVDLKTLKKSEIDPMKFSYYAVEYPWRGCIVKKVISSGKNFYIVFGGGTKNINCRLSVDYACYDNDGFAREIFWKDWFEIYYYDKTNNINSTKNIEDLLKNNPKLFEKYLNEKKESDKKAWKRNRVIIEMRYLKLYIKDSK